MFFRWEIADEGIAVDIHLNVVELLERDAMRARGKMAGGFLLGRVNRGRVLTLTVEHYEPVTPERGVSGSPFADCERMEAMVNRWRPGHSRLSLIGLYRTCMPQNVFLTNDDLSALAAHFKDRAVDIIGTSLDGSKLSPQATAPPAADPEDAERVFLLIEPAVGGTNSKAVLHLTRGGTVVWQSPSTLFNRNELSRRRAANQSQVSEMRPPLAEPEQSSEAATEEATVAPRISFKKVRALKWGAVSLGVVMLLITTFFQVRGRFGFSSPFPTAPATPADTHLGLKLDQTGTSWKLSWNAESPALASATKGRLVVTDGGMHKEIDLDSADLRGGTIIYSPITQDVVLRLEVDSAGSPEPVSESVRTVGGLLVSPLSPTDASNALPPSADDAGAQQSPGPAAEPPPTTDLGRPAVPPSQNSASARTAEEELGRPTTTPASKPSVPVQTAELQPAQPKTLNRTPPATRAEAKPVEKHAMTASRPTLPVVAPPAAPPIPKISAPVRTAETQPFKANVPRKTEPVIEKAKPADSHRKVALRPPAQTPQRHPAPEPPPTVAERLPAVTPATVHHAVAQVAELISKRDPDYPLPAKQARVSGAVEVNFTIDANGQVRDVKVTKGPALLESAAVEAVQEWRYKPARLDGVPVATQGNAVVVFRVN
ncbi:MAG: TonB family protein [Candidatus Acidiferrales bacterium]